MEMIMSKSKPITPGAAVFYGGLIAGILDAADGVLAYYFAAGFNPVQVLQFIATGFYGAAAFQRGSRARFVRWLSNRLGSPTHYKPVRLQYPGGLTGSSIATKE